MYYCVILIFFLVATIYKMFKISRTRKIMNKIIGFLAVSLCFILKIFLYPITRLLQIGRYRQCPPIDDQLLLTSATKLAKMIKEKEVSSEEVVRAFIKRCKQVNPILNAIVEDRFDAAVEDARHIDFMITSNSPDIVNKPLLGVPITVKESIGVQGLSNNSGRIWPKGQRIAKHDAECVELARAAGAIPILVSNTPELCMNWETNNKITGVTRNPYDTRRTPGGSSGGEAALISSGASVIGIGSDICGSLRLPAMFTGIFGHKPSPGVVSTVGHVPDCCNPDWPLYFALGPIARYAEDLPLLLQVIAGQKGAELKLDEPVDIRKLKFYYMKDDGGALVTDRISDDVKMAMNRAISALEYELNVKAEQVTQLTELKKVFSFSTSILLNINGVENPFSDEKNPEKMKSVWPELIKYIFCMSKTTCVPFLYGILRNTIGNISARKLERVTRMNNNLQAEFDELLRDNGVFLYPTFPTAAHYHNEIFYKFLNSCYLLIFNTLGLPVTNCPIGLTSDGLPVGIQIVANRGQDRLTLAVAKEFERIFGGWTPPPAPDSINIPERKSYIRI